MELINEIILFSAVKSDILPLSMVALCCAVYAFFILTYPIETAMSAVAKKMRKRA